jgi:hypothetical protein
MPLTSLSQRQLIAPKLDMKGHVLPSLSSFANLAAFSALFELPLVPAVAGFTFALAVDEHSFEGAEGGGGAGAGIGRSSACSKMDGRSGAGD